MEKKKIMIIDDDSKSTLKLSRLLMDAGYTTVTIKPGQSGAFGNMRPDLLLVNAEYANSISNYDALISHTISQEYTKSNGYDNEMPKVRLTMTIPQYVLYLLQMREATA